MKGKGTKQHNERPPELPNSPGAKKSEQEDLDLLQFSPGANSIAHTCKILQVLILLNNAASIKIRIPPLKPTQNSEFDRLSPEKSEE
jgi:hypothetical protein